MAQELDLASDADDVRAELHRDAVRRLVVDIDGGARDLHSPFHEVFETAQTAVAKQTLASEEGQGVRRAGPCLARIEVNLIAERIYGLPSLLVGRYPRDVRKSPARVDTERYGPIRQRAMRSWKDIAQILMFDCSLISLCVIVNETLGVFRKGYDWGHEQRRLVVVDVEVEVSHIQDVAMHDSTKEAKETLLLTHFPGPCQEHTE